MVYDANPISKEQLEMAINDQLESAGLPTDEQELIDFISEHGGGGGPEYIEFAYNEINIATYIGPISPFIPADKCV